MTRQLTLIEEEGPGGPSMLLLNNTRWNGQKYGSSWEPVSGAELIYGTPEPSMHDTYASELPRVGSTEVWEVINISADAHPIHLHLVQFQILNRQAINADEYLDAYEAAFPGDGDIPAGEFIPEFGPPNDYLTPNDDGAVGGNPAVSPFLVGSVIPPDPNENGWKDTIKDLSRYGDQDCRPLCPSRHSGRGGCCGRQPLPV